MILLALYLCVCVSVCFFASARHFLYDPMNWMSDWPGQFFRAFATVFTDAVLAYDTLLRDFAFFSPSLFSTCVLFTSLITCSTKIPWRAWMFSSLQLFRYMLYFLWELGISCSNTVLFALVIGPSLGFK